MYTPSVKTLVEGLGITRDAAISLRNHMICVDMGTETAEQVLEVANGYMKMHGVEYMRESDVYYQDGIEYVNTGETYQTTLTYDRVDELFRVCSWGDLQESLEKKKG